MGEFYFPYGVFFFGKETLSKKKFLGFLPPKKTINSPRWKKADKKSFYFFFFGGTPRFLSLPPPPQIFFFSGEVLVFQNKRQKKNNEKKIWGGFFKNFHGHCPLGKISPQVFWGLFAVFLKSPPFGSPPENLFFPPIIFFFWREKICPPPPSPWGRGPRKMPQMPGGFGKEALMGKKAFLNLRFPTKPGTPFFFGAP